MRALLFAAVGLAALPASAQTFRLVDPALTVGGTRIGVVGAPLVQEPFGQLALAVPGEGTYRVSDVPFDGSRAVGQFDGNGLYFAVDGRSVRLRSSGPILEDGQPTPAHVRFDPELTRAARGLARVSVSDAPGFAARSSASPAQPGVLQRGTASPAMDDRADMLGAELVRTQQALAVMTAERDALVTERDAARRDLDALRRAAPDRTGLTVDRASPERDRAAWPVAIPAPEAPVAAARRGSASFPGFDMERLANPDAVRRRLDETEYPPSASAGDLAGDVLVLFETDASGRVIRTAVATPIGGGLDGLAESLVREMQVVPPVVDGQRTGLRSQVLVRFER